MRSGFHSPDDQGQPGGGRQKDLDDIEKLIGRVSSGNEGVIDLGDGEAAFVNPGSPEGRAAIEKTMESLPSDAAKGLKDILDGYQDGSLPAEMGEMLMALDREKVENHNNLLTHEMSLIGSKLIVMGVPRMLVTALMMSFRGHMRYSQILAWRAAKKDILGDQGEWKPDSPGFGEKWDNNQDDDPNGNNGGEDSASP